jgi:hypothetical protein
MHMATAKKPAAKKGAKPAPKKRLSDAAQVRKDMERKRKENPESCIFC